MSLHPEPTEISAGNTLRFLKSIDSFTVDELTQISPIADGYALGYALRGSVGAIDIAATVSGSEYLVNEAAAVTALWNPGLYSWAAYLTLGANRYQADSGQTTILPNLATADAGFEARSYARIMFDGITAALAGRATSAINSYSYAGKSVSKMSHAEMVTAWNFWREQVRLEESAALIAAGGDGGRNIYTRFGAA